MSTSQDENLLQQEVVTCPAVGYQEVTVCVPVTVTPFGNAGTATTFCCGSPTVTTDMTPCAGTVNGSCMFKITQEMCVAVPVEFGATAVTGAPHVQCGDASAVDICTDCGFSAGGVASSATAKKNCTSCK
ncbi:hypothetical protein SDC9_211536 [bioreactor metagenome]|uniref:Uncharacterized protein n=1 Tax=bioreactor metagenome TaxID=1076179 RepID=A0A645JKY7_9ZZZZ